MSILDWIFVGLIILAFLVVFFLATVDLFRDRKYYKQKQRNVTELKSRKSVQKNKK